MSHALELQNTQNRRLTVDNYKTLALTGLGGALEYYEFVVFILLTPYISQSFFPTDIPDWIRTLQTLAIFAAGYLVRPLGGIVLGMMGDRLGRKSIFALTIFLMAAPTLLIGLLPSYQSIGIAAPILLLVCRILQGLALGGEIPGAVVFVSEHVPYNRLGLACGVVGASLSVGLLIGTVIVGLSVGHYDRNDIMAFGWRLPFVIGGLFGLVVAYLRRYVRETPVFLEIKKRKDFGRHSPLKILFRSSGRAIVYSVMITMTTAAIVPAVYLFPRVYFLTTLKLDPPLVQSAHTWAVVAMIVGSIFGGWLTDKIGGIKVFMMFTAGAIASVFWIFTGVLHSPQDLPIAYTVVGFFCSITAFGYYFVVQAFPSETRFTGLSLTSNISSAVLGGITPLLLAAAMRVDQLAVAYYVTLFGLVGILGASLVWPLRKEIGNGPVEQTAAPALAPA